MVEILLPIGFAIGVWWLTTGVALYLGARPTSAYGVIMVLVTVMLVAAIAGLVQIGHDTSVEAAYLGFVYGVLIWGWHELSFLTGYVTGPRDTECPRGASGWQRFIYAAQTIMHHEFAILLTGVLLIMLCWNLPNNAGLLTFTVLWGMRISAKLNVFFGVPNMTDEFLPARMRYLESYFRRAPMTRFFALSVSVATIVTGAVIYQALTSVPGSFEATKFWLLSTLMLLAVIEHWFLVLNIREAALWTWLFGSSIKTEAATTGPTHPGATHANAEPPVSTSANKISTAGQKRMAVSPL